MTLLSQVAGRLQRSDLAQIVALFLAVLVVALTVNWPDGGARVNEAWFAVAPLRNSLLALVGLAFGAQHGAQVVRQDPNRAGTALLPRALSVRLTWLALLVIVLLTWPFELIAHAGSYPATPSYWPALVAPLTVTGFFGLGLLLGRLVRGPFSGMLLLIAVPALLAGLVWADFAFDLVIVNPWAAPLTVAPAYLATMAVLSLVTLLAVRMPRLGNQVQSA